MAVYVDDFNAPYRNMTMCHMMADTLDELHEMADKIGVNRKWFQGKQPWLHYDICLSKKKLAIRYGAIEITAREMVLKFKDKTLALDRFIPGVK